ncbi:uncharacterized protein LOC133800219 [Humulus lupulus]|uniref:uncharacterized protein LOC133800219 n=1 Tax=Humulus lupulus TaxID=3486 RepID=UPI002B4161BF|nr:uncharacterized protein LOC133800219 [Humulus lupulus]
MIRHTSTLHITENEKDLDDQSSSASSDNSSDDWSKEMSSTSDDTIPSDPESLSSKNLSSNDDGAFPHLMVQPTKSNSQTEPIITSEEESGNESTTPHVPQKRKSKGTLQDAQVTERLRTEFFKLKCCSMDKRDLKKHYKKMTQQFYQIGGIDDPNLKQAFLSSIPEPLGEETFILLSGTARTLADATIGEIYQLVLKALEKMCSRYKFIQEFMKQSKKLGNVCSQKDLRIKCPPESACSCLPEKKKHNKRFKPFKTLKSSKEKGCRSFKFLRRKRSFRKKSDKCFICGDKGHYAKQCPKGKTAKLISHIQQTTGISLEENDLESIFSTDDEINPESLCAFE